MADGARAEAAVPAGGAGSCAICCEELERVTVLPCACKVAYCDACWDRALASSFNSCGQARCPTCRTAICVDFDPETGSLVFSREDMDFTYSHERDENFRAIVEARERAVTKLAEQAKPRQVTNLERFGASNLWLGAILESPEAVLGKRSISELKRHAAALDADVSDCVEKEDLIRRLLGAARGPRRLALHLAAAEEAEPTCVCGSSLQCFSGKERCRQFCRAMTEDAPDSRVFEAYLAEYSRSGMCPVICDLCDNSLAMESMVWTCRSNTCTILHATSYDVCERCVARHALGAQGALGGGGGGGGI